MVKKLLHTRYRVHDLEETVSFYKDVLGLEELRRQTSGRGSQLVFLRAPGSEEEIEICKFDESGPVTVGPDLTNLGGEIESRALDPIRCAAFFAGGSALRLLPGIELIERSKKS